MAGHVTLCVGKGRGKDVASATHFASPASVRPYVSDRLAGWLADFCAGVSLSPSLCVSISPSLHLSISPSLHLSISPSISLSSPFASSTQHTEFVPGEERGSGGCYCGSETMRRGREEAERSLEGRAERSLEGRAERSLEGRAERGREWQEATASPPGVMVVASPDVPIAGNATDKERILRTERRQDKNRGCCCGYYARIMGNVCSSGPSTANHSAHNEDVENGAARDKQQRKQLQRIPTFSKVHARLREDCKVRDAYKIGKTYVLRSCLSVLKASSLSPSFSFFLLLSPSFSFFLLLSLLLLHGCWGVCGTVGLWGSTSRTRSRTRAGLRTCRVVICSLNQLTSWLKPAGFLLVVWGRVDFRW